MSRIKFPNISHICRLEKIRQILSFVIVPKKTVKTLLSELNTLSKSVVPDLKDKVFQLVHQCVDHLINRKVEKIVDEFRRGKDVQKAIRILENRYALSGENRALLSIAKRRQVLDETVYEKLLEIATSLILQRTGEAKWHIQGLPQEVFDSIDWKNPFEEILKTLLGRRVSSREVKNFMQELINFAEPL